MESNLVLWNDIHSFLNGRLGVSDFKREFSTAVERLFSWVYGSDQILCFITSVYLK